MSFIKTALLATLQVVSAMSESTSSAAVPRTQQIKLVQAGRRKPDITQQEYIDYRFQKHGNISAATVPGYDPPYKYIQTQLSLSVFYPQQNTPPPPNANQPWVGRDDITELYLRDTAHLLSTFAGNYTKTVVGPDALNFGDVETSMSLVAKEKFIPLTASAGSGGADREAKGKRDIDSGDNEVGFFFFLAAKNGTKDGTALERELTPVVVEELRALKGEAWGLSASVGTQVEGFDPIGYFGGLGLHALTYKVFLKTRGSQAAVRGAQKNVFERAGGNIELANSFAVWGKEGLVLDQGRGIDYDPRRQPKVLC
ncbi:hypothetical protein KVT40_002641 [Elsinoe batatas]|uniref:EthD domain-containing protein n=1 Tax=Elsinoe batatas TaxID=2601811 RepID=A0A8K0L6S8_9PEZI|nr:hypothetical protein KVT40_002641 [Elsinoe batatas]